MHQRKDEEAPLREDIRLLGGLLGKTLKNQVGERFYDLVEEIRALSKSARQENNLEAETWLRQLIRSLGDDETLVLARSFSHFLNLANIAENYHKMRSHRNDDERAISKACGPSPGSLPGHRCG